MPLHPLQEMQVYMFPMSKPMFFCLLPSNLHIDQSTLCFLVDGIRTLVNVIIVDPIRVDLVLHVALSHRVAKIVMVQTKERLY